MKRLLIVLFILLSNQIRSQVTDVDKPAYALDSVFITSLADSSLLKAYNHITLADSLANSLSLPQLIEQNSSVFIKEYGRGMLASISMRGTGAAHTQIVWNGIPVNSILTGQTDLNTFSPAGFERIILKKGGSSVSYGSGAIGGVLIFEDQMHFQKYFELQNQTKLGSFMTGLNHFKIVNANNRFYTKLNVRLQKSENNYPYPDYPVVNENGAYQGIDYGLVAGWRLNRQNRFYFKSKISYWDRETSRTLYMPQNAKLITGNQRFISGWQYRHKHFFSQTDVAYLYENYQYFFNKSIDEHSDSHSQTYWLKNLLTWQPNNRQKIIIGNEYNRQQATGDHFNRHQRDNYALFAIWSHQIARWSYRLKLRQDFSSGIKIPLTGAIESIYTLNKYQNIRANISRNFRLPTFNDLYWTPGGNPDLHPEDSFSFEAGYDFNNTQTAFHITGFYINSQNLIKWTPGNNGLWQPINFEQVVYKGVEISGKQKIKITPKIFIEDEIHGTYQSAINQKSHKVLAFTPQWVGQNTLNLRFSKFLWTYHYRYQGKIYTTTSQTKFLPAYHLHNVSLTYRYNRHFKFRINVNNLLNTYYENVPTRPQPGRNYEFIINFKI